jgi:EpsI family protein
LAWLVGKFATINELRQFVVIGMFQVVMLAVLGMQVYRAILFPALYLFFLVPFGQYLVPPMQAFATWFTDAGLTFLGVLHFTEGNIIELTNGRFEVAEACAGLRFLIATVALAVLFAHLNYRKLYKVALLLSASVIVPLIANGLRCLGIILLAHVTNNQLAVGADHLLYGWIFNVAILSVVFIFGRWFRDSAPVSNSLLQGDARAAAPPRLKLLLLTLGTALSISSGPALAYWHENRPARASIKAFAEPLKLGVWTAVPNVKGWRPSYSGADREFIGSVISASPHSQPVDLAIEYYDRNREGHSLIATTNNLWDESVWHQTEAHTIKARIGDTMLQLNEAIVDSSMEKRIVWSSYWMDNRFTRSVLSVKLLQLKTVFTGSEAAALVVFSTPIDGTLEDARARLTRVITTSADLPRRLAEVANAP